MRFKGLLIIFKILCLWSVNAFGQYYANSETHKEIDVLTREHGLSSNSIFDILQDHDGFLWFATQTGLSKYDGYHVQNFLYEIDDPRSLTNSFVKNLLVDNKGRLLLATWGGGVNIFDQEKQTFLSFHKEFDIAADAIHSHIEDIHQAKDQSFWLSTLFGLVHFDPATKRLDKFFYHSSDPHSISDNWTTKIFERQNGTMMFVGKDYRLNVFNTGENNFRRYEIPRTSGKKGLIRITHLYEDAYQNLLVGTDHGLYLFDQETGSFTHVISDSKTRKALVNNPINEIMAIEASKLWLGTAKGVIVLNQQQSDTKQVRYSGNSQFLQSDAIRKTYKDFQGNLWVGTEHNGVKVFYNKKKPFARIDIGNRTVQSLTIDKENNLWLGTNDGLFQLGKDKKIKKRYTVEKGLSSNEVRSMLVEEKRILVGTNKGLDIIDLETGAVILWREGNNILNTPIVTIRKDESGDYWLGSDQKGLVHIDKNSGEVTNYVASSKHLSIGNYNVTSLCFGSKDKLWVGIYGGGINLFDMQKLKFVRRYLNDPENPSSLLDNNVLAIYKDTSGILWIATNDGGLNRFNSQDHSFTSFLKKDGMPSNSVRLITEDADKNLWIGTHQGLVKLAIDTTKVKYFDTSDGLISNDFLSRSVCKDSKGRLYFGSDQGVVHFNADQIKDNTDAPQLQFTNFKIDNEEIDFNAEDAPMQKHVSRAKSVVLEHNQTAIAIEYVALNYISSSKNKYAFKMEGLEDDWRAVADQRVAYYSNLPAGKYTFMVKASNNDGIWTPEPLTLAIQVLPHPLNSNLAYSIYWVLFLVLNIIVIWLVKSFTKRKQQIKVAQIERQTEKELTQFKLQFFTNISHELRTHLTLIEYPINKMLKKTGRSVEDKNLLDRVDLNVKRLEKLTDEIIDFRKAEQGKTKVEFQKSNVVDFIQEIANLFVPIAKEHELQFEFQAAQTELIWCFDQEKLKKTLFNLLTNAVKYTPNGGWIKLSVKRLNSKDGQNEKLRISIADNGVGIAEEHLPYIFDRFFNPNKDQLQNDFQSSSGIGLALVKRLVELQQGTIYAESTPGEGSHFYFDLEKVECSENVAAGPESVIQVEAYDKWEQILELERVNVQEELQVTNEVKEEEKPVVLIVDDKKEICRILNDILQNHYKVFAAGNGQKALEIAARENIDIVVSDIMMPVMDGIALCNHLKSDIKTSHIPVILLTAKSGIDNELEGLRTGADAYLTKPFNTEKVLLTVKNSIENRKKLQLVYQGDKPKEANQPGLNPIDSKLMDRVYEVINEKLSEADFSVDVLGREVGLSRMHLFRKLKALTGESPSDLIKKTRLEKSKTLLKEGELSIAAIAYDTGFSSAGNFSTAFKKYYGETPAKFRKNYFVKLV